MRIHLDSYNNRSVHIFTISCTTCMHYSTNIYAHSCQSNLWNLWFKKLTLYFYMHFYRSKIQIFESKMKVKNCTCMFCWFSTVNIIRVLAKKREDVYVIVWGPFNKNYQAGMCDAVIWLFTKYMWFFKRECMHYYHHCYEFTLFSSSSRRIDAPSFSVTHSEKTLPILATSWRWF